ncbi:hypothetical protein R1flu_002565 [Riccia fluitans]|uniref:Uncharacterized protein n=1 Tax=Riccia fluitans TaxID=41844 RepID=A0ABD1Y6M9_9MARC
MLAEQCPPQWDNRELIISRQHNHLGHKLLRRTSTYAACCCLARRTLTGTKGICIADALAKVAGTCRTITAFGIVLSSVRFVKKKMLSLFGDISPPESSNNLLDRQHPVGHYRSRF